MFVYGGKEMSVRGKTVQIRRFIFDNLSANPGSIALLVMKRFGITRQAACKHLRDLEELGAIESQGRTRGKQYQLKALAEVDGIISVAGLEEHVPWEGKIRPQLEGLKSNVLAICHYGFTEMLNNVIDHSGSENVHLRMFRTHDCIDLQIMDFGIGIFRKIKEHFGLPDELEAIKQLVKGKLTTDSTRHTGEGIFFTSRMFDCFSILSGNLYWSHVRQDNDWLIEDQQSESNGTFVRMTIAADSNLKITAVFDEYSASGSEYSFSKTTVPVSLLQYGCENLLSRSQAKRLIGRFEMFREVILDFAGVEFIGQGFADEIFRVFANNNPNVQLTSINTANEVAKMISRAKGQPPSPKQLKLF